MPNLIALDLQTKEKSGGDKVDMFKATITQCDLSLQLFSIIDATLLCEFESNKI